MSFRRAALGLSVIALAVGTAAPAGAAIVPGQGIAGVSLDMTRPQVRDVLGAPDKVVKSNNDFGPFTVYRYHRLRVFFQGNEGATAVTTRRYSEKTAKGIGRGSLETALRAAHPRAKCRTEPGGFRHCWLGRFRPGRVVTDFAIGNDRVYRVTVAYVID